MKKLLIFLTILFSFLFIDNVKAYSISYVPSDFIQNNLIIDSSTLSTLPNVNSNVLSNFDTKLAQKFDFNNYYYVSYVKIPKNNGTPYIETTYWAKNQNVPVYFNVGYEQYQYSYHSLNLALIPSSAIYSSKITYNLGSSNSSYTFNTNRNYSSSKFNDFFGYIFSSNGSIFNQLGTTHFDYNTYFYRSNYNIPYYSSLYTPYAQTITNFYVTDNGDSTLISNGDIFLNDSLELPFLVPPAPTFTFSLDPHYDQFNRLVNVDIGLFISDYSSDFIIQYQKGGTSGTWTTILPEYDSILGYYFGWNNWTENTTIYVRALYNNEVVSTASQEISGIIPNYESGQVNSFGSNSFGISSNQVEIHSNGLFDSVVCSSERAFANNVCYVNDSDILDISDKLSKRIYTNFYFSMNNINIPYTGDKYYLFGYRSYFSNVYLPYNISILSANTINSTATILDSRVYEHGLYRDYVILFSSSSSQSLVAVDGITLNFASLDNIFTSFPDSFVLGFYNGVKYKQFDILPTDTDIQNFYDTNTLDSLNNDSLLNYFSQFNVNDHGLSSIILKPIDFLSYLTNSTCSPITIPLPHTNNSLTLPCIRSEFQIHLPDLFNLYQIIVSGLICYRIGLGMFRIIKNLFSPEDDKVEVIDL